MAELTRFLERAEALLERVERLLPPEPPQPDSPIAFRWRRRNGRGLLQPVAHPHRIRLRICRASIARETSSSRTPGSSCAACRPTTCC